MFYTYVLWSDSIRKRYVGSTEDLVIRLEQHNTGQSVFTKRGMPWTVIHTECFLTRKDAERRERDLKSGHGRAWLDNTYPSTSRKHSC